MIIDKIVNVVTNAINKMSMPAETLPAILLQATTIQRPGLSPSKIAAKVIANNNALGIPTGTNNDGSPNLINEYTYNIVKAIVEAIQEDGVIQVVIPTGAITVQAEGGNAGGPVVAIGTNITDTTVKGIIR